MPMDENRKIPYWHCLKHDMKFFTVEEFRKHFEEDLDHKKERQDHIEKALKKDDRT